MSETFLGFPPQTWGILCLAVAGFYLLKWPRPKDSGMTPARSRRASIILRWFHSAVWLLLALACFVWAAGNPSAATPIALLALVVYLIFLFTLIADRRSGPP